MSPVSYDKIAGFYDAVMGDRTETADYLRYLIVQHKPEAKNLLELACGTGAVLKLLAKSYDVTGLDLSPRMLSMARKKLPRVRFFRRNMVSFDLGRKFDVIVCVFDSINHVFRFGDWKRIFRSAREHLHEEGLFVFDINTADKLQRHIRTPPQVTAFGRNWLVIHVANAGHGMADWTLKVFEHKGRGCYKVVEENIREISFPLKKIRRALAQQFQVVKVIDPLGVRPSRRSDRLYFVCIR